jgi:hypothetical protein
VEKFTKKRAAQLAGQLTEIVEIMMEEVHDAYTTSGHVDSGWARGSWDVSIGEPNDGLAMGPIRPPRKSKTDPPAVKIPKIKMGDRIFLCNGVPYIQIIENKYGITAAVIARTRRRVRGVK